MTPDPALPPPVGAPLDEILTDLARPTAYPHPADPVEVRQTHASVVFLAGDFAYKLKKPVDLGFLDFSTPALRAADCVAEVQLNRRLAAWVYLDVVAVTRGHGGLSLGGAGSGPVVEHAVRMRRLPDDRTFSSLLSRGALTSEHLVRLAEHIARFHAEAARGPAVSRAADVEAVAANCRGNVEGLRAFGDGPVTASAVDLLETFTASALERLGEQIHARALRRACDTHGDLRLDHVYDLPTRPSPQDLAVIDCVEFCDGFRFADPIADVAFLAMELEFAGHPEMASCWIDAYLQASKDPEGRQLVPFYVAYRDAVRAKVRCIEAAEPEVEPPARVQAAARAQRHLLRALVGLAPAARRPCLVLASGLPGSGKSTLARSLAADGFHRVSSDATRKQLAGLDPSLPASDELEHGIYTAEWTERTYAECRRRAQASLADGGRVVVDATFGSEILRRQFLELAGQLAVPALWLVCHVSEEEASRRVAARGPGESDADVAVLEMIRRRWEEPQPETAAARVVIDAEGSPAATLERARAALAARGLA